MVQLEPVRPNPENRTGVYTYDEPPNFTRAGHVEAHLRLGIGLLRLRSAPRKTLYEEYHPYGTSAYRAFQSSEVSAKRYRYTGKERDAAPGSAGTARQRCGGAPQLGQP